ncbi:MAG: V-type ATP synthase subunit D [Bacteroidales bacterium]
MAIRFQFNKTSLNDLDKNLKVRQKALPTIKNKESALRVEVKKAKADAERLNQLLNADIEKYNEMSRLFNEFEASLLTVEDVDLAFVKIAGVRIPVLKNIRFHEDEFNLFYGPFWYAEGIQILKNLASLGIESEVYMYKMRLLDASRKKTTQKVNLYEKVQIPGYIEAIRKIKRFLEDEENLSKSAQKIVKQRQAEEAAQ